MRLAVINRLPLSLKPLTLRFRRLAFIYNHLKKWLYSYAVNGYETVITVSFIRA